MQVRVLTPTEETLLAFWRDIFARGEIGVEDDFFVLGGHSLLAALLSTKVAEVFGFELPLAQVFETPTIVELARYVDRRRAAAMSPRLTSSSLVRLAAGGSRPPLFCMHNLLGGVGDYLPLARHLPADQPVYAVRGRGLVGDALPLTSLSAMAAHCVKELRTLQPRGPYRLAGASFAGLVALEAARLLRAGGEEVALLALFDTWLPYDPARPRLLAHIRRYIRLQRLRAEYHVGRRRRYARHYLREFVALPAPERPAYLRARTRMLVDYLRRRGASSQDGAPREVLELEVRHNRLLHASQAALVRYRPSPYDGRIVYFLAADRTGAPPIDQARAWAGIARGGLEVHRLSCDHTAMLAEPNVQAVAGILGRRLTAQPSRAST